MSDRDAALDKKEGDVISAASLLANFNEQIRRLLVNSKEASVAWDNFNRAVEEHNACEGPVG